MPISPARVFLRIWGSPNGSLLDLEGTGFRACTKEKNQRNPLAVTALHTKRG